MFFFVFRFFFLNYFFLKFFQEYQQSVQYKCCLDPDQASHIIRPDLGPNCLQRYQLMTLVGKSKATILNVLYIYCCIVMY